jgi:aromatic ring-opening dioxygenase catalytic subunit (LigB family)
MEGDFRRNFDRLEQSLVEMRQGLENRVKAVLVISGHWEESGFAISSGERPGMVYDYFGFPDYLYQISYPAPGSPELARRVQQLLADGGVDARLAPSRGFDHGTFSMMKPLYPEADVPVVQLSLDRSLDPSLHLEVGRLLKPLRDEGVLIIGSGLSYHNLREMRDQSGVVPSRKFDAWLQEALKSPPKQRTEKLIHWDEAPLARAAHPREDHLIPLMAAVGAAEDEPAETIYHQSDLMGGITASSFRFGALPAK